MGNTGEPPLGVYDLNGLIAERPGEGTSFFSKLKFIFLALSRLPGFIANTPGKATERADAVSSYLNTTAVPRKADFLSGIVHQSDKEREGVREDRRHWVSSHAFS